MSRRQSGVLAAALAQLRDYRDRQGLIDPRKAADANAALAGRLRNELMRAQTDLSTMKEYAPAGRCPGAQAPRRRASQP